MFDIADYYLPNDTQNLLVNKERFGDALAKTFLTPAHNASTAIITEPDHYLVLQRGHGFAVLGTSIPETVYRAVYTTWNADVQASALTINHAAEEVNHGVKYLTAEEVSGTLTMDNADYSKEWPGKQNQFEHFIPLFHANADFWDLLLSMGCASQSESAVQERSRLRSGSDVIMSSPILLLSWVWASRSSSFYSKATSLLASIQILYRKKLPSLRQMMMMKILEEVS